MENKLLRKEQCPDCAKNGGDTSKDNMAVYSDGQTHCFACGTHGFVEHKEKVQVAEKTTKKDWMVEYNRGDYYSTARQKTKKTETLREV